MKDTSRMACFLPRGLVLILHPLVSHQVNLSLHKEPSSLRRSLLLCFLLMRRLPGYRWSLCQEPTSQQGWLPLLHPPYEEIIVTGVPMLPPPKAIIHQQGGDPFLFPASGTKVAAEKSFQPATKKESPKKKWKWLAGAAKGKYKDYRKK